MAADVPPVPEGWREVADDFFVFEIVPPGKGTGNRRFDPPFGLFLVSVETDTPNGARWNNDPLGLIREDIEEDVFRIKQEPDVKVITLRVNAEVPANPKYGFAKVMTYPGSTTVVIVHFKVDPRGAAA